MPTPSSRPFPARCAGVSRGGPVLVLALVVDSLGNGLFLPLSLIFFLALTDVPLALLGALLTAATAITLPVPIWAGALADRFGALAVVVAAQVLQAAGFVAYAHVGGPVSVFAAAALVAVGVRLFWSVIFTALADYAENSAGTWALDTWYSISNGARTAGLAAGGLVTGVVLADGRAGTYIAVAYAAAICFAAAAGLIAAFVRIPHTRHRVEPDQAGGAGGYRVVLRDRAFVALVGVNTIFALASIMLGLALPTVVQQVFAGPGWLTAGVLAGNALAIAVAGRPGRGAAAALPAHPGAGGRGRAVVRLGARHGRPRPGTARRGGRRSGHGHRGLHRRGADPRPRLHRPGRRGRRRPVCAGATWRPSSTPSPSPPWSPRCSSPPCSPLPPLPRGWCWRRWSRIGGVADAGPGAGLPAGRAAPRRAHQARTSAEPATHHRDLAPGGGRLAGVGGPTQRVMDTATVQALVTASLGASVEVAAASPLVGGEFAVVWRVDLADSRALVLKAGPPDGVPLLGYERDLVAAEAAYLNLVGDRAPDVPIPRLLAFGSDRTVLDGDWLITTLLPGRSLPAWQGAHPGGDAGPARRALGAAVAGLGAITSPRFGYTGQRPGGDTWPAAFTAIIEDLLADAGRWQVTLPGGAGRLRALLARAHDVLAEVDAARLVHVDLWDGNVLATTTRPAAAPVAALCGLVDGERHLFGDPLVDLVSPALFTRIEDRLGHPFLAGWAHALGRPATFTPAEKVRLGLYRVHLYLLMLTEMPSRGAGRDHARRTMLSDLLDEETARVEATLRR